jgi:RNA polymerase subunit RPABC4/transcription elongation factor Spt4
MPVCKNCRVEIDEGLERCPLCLAPLGGEAE